MNEKLLQYIWQYQLFNKQHLQTIDELPLSIIHPGYSNSNQGPDFLNGKIKIAETMWVGNIELHIYTTDWNLHKHSDDSNYNNVILHVVWDHDKDLHLPFPTIELKSLVPKLLLDKYNGLMNQHSFIPCENNISDVNQIVIAKFKERLLIERLQSKSILVEALLVSSKSNWKEVCWWMLANNMGGKVNGEAFQQIAQHTPINILLKHTHSLFQIEAILMGQGGLLIPNYTDQYPQALRKEYRFFQKKYSLIPPKVSIHFLRMRPPNFPTIRLSQLAALVKSFSILISSIVEADDLSVIKSLLNIEADKYWATHYVFDELSKYKLKRLGTQTIDSIIINTIVFLLYSYGYYNNIEHLQTKAIRWLEEISAEKNNICNAFEQLGIDNNSAFDSQALLQLKSKYCDDKRCLDCAIGISVIKQNNSTNITTNGKW